ncbi:ferritin-like domain-containing protein [Microcoleus sp. FACHB-672]|uniref:ferritin-like domain-containing protein n=1 Tax=Microcoleus sp. FACHB-672 TaxID=2692825 RepID=UPI00168A08A9|nr:DUF455 family protein [Microcoleus sp. FACHB-672]MBD2041427.1 DUF455 family protein [Microcoleus sp. FACHB-672]
MKPAIEFGDFWNLNQKIDCLNSKALTPSDIASMPWEEDGELIKSQRARELRNYISAYIYSLLRSLEFEACWLISCKNSDFKILLGEKMGWDARFIEALHTRMFEKLTLAYIPKVGSDYSQNFDYAKFLQTESEIAAFLYALSQDYYSHIQNYLNHSDMIADAPTCLTLRHLLTDLTDILNQLHSWIDQDVKIYSLSQPCETVACYSGREEMPAIPSFPRRSPHLQFSETSIVIHQSYADLMTDNEKLRRFSHYVYVDVEIAAMEVCAKNLVAYRWMPLDFKLDMARQIWDEARHAIIMRRLLESIGGKEGDYTYSAKVWKKCEKGSNLAERLAIQQVFQEGNALESNFLLTEAFSTSSHHEMTYYMDCINADEAVHVRIGNLWMQYLLEGNYDHYRATMEKAVSQINATLSSNVVVNHTARNISAFPSDFVTTLEENNKIYGYRKS